MLPITHAKAPITPSIVTLLACAALSGEGIHVEVTGAFDQITNEWDELAESARAAPFLRPGKTVVVMGVGGLGHIGIQLLQAMTAAQIIAVDPSQTGQQLARELLQVRGPEVCVEQVRQMQLRERQLRGESFDLLAL